MQNARTAPLNMLETHYAAFYANCTHCAPWKRSYAVFRTHYALCRRHHAHVCITASASRFSDWGDVTWRFLHILHKAKGMNGSFRDVRVSTLFQKRRTDNEMDPACQKWTYSTKHYVYIFLWEKKNIFVDEPLGICHHCDKGNILRNKYLAAQSWMRIPIKIEFHEFHLFSFLRAKVLKYAYLICMAFKKC